MKGGFSFCGVDIDSLGLTFVPELPNTVTPYVGSSYSVSALTDGTREGGYFYGATVKPKDFTLRCIFEEEDIRYGIITKIQNLFQRGRTGRLIFKNRDWIWYTATVTQSPDFSKITNYKNGFVTVKLTAYYPYGRCTDFLYISPTESDKTKLNEGAFLFSTEMPSVPTTWNLTNNFLLYNPGTEKAKCAITIAGNIVDGVTIINNTTNQTCELSGINTLTQSLIVDGLNGKVVLTGGEGNPQMAFKYHKGGFIELAPGKNVETDIVLTRTNTTNKIFNTIKESSGGLPLDETYVGKWIVYPNIQAKIVSVNNGIITLDRAANLSGKTVKIVDCMNEITVKRNTSDVSISNLQFQYCATFR